MVSLEGELDLGSSRQLDQAIGLAMRTGPGRVVVDLGGLWFIDLAGLRALIATRERGLQEGQEVVMTNPPAAVRRLLSLARMETLLPILEGANEV